MQSTQPDLSLRRRSFGESCQLAYNVLRAQVGPLCGALAFLFVPLQLLRLARNCFAPDSHVMEGHGHMGKHMAPHMGEHLPPMEQRNIVLFISLSFLYLLVAIVAAAAVWPVCAHIVASHLLGEPASAKSAIKASSRVVVRVVATSFAAFLALFLLVSCMAILVFTMAGGFFQKVFFGAVQDAMDVSQSVLKLPSEQEGANSASSTDDSKSTLGIIVAIILFSSGILAFIFLSIRWSFASIVACMEPHYWGFSALWRSARLSKGLFRQILLGHIVIYVIGYPYRIVENMTEMGQMMLHDGKVTHWELLPAILLGMAAAVAIHVLLQALSAILFTVLYFGGRSMHDSKEGVNAFNENSLSSFIHGGMEVDAGTELGYRPFKSEQETLMPHSSSPE